MATSSESNNWFWVYFTSVNNVAKCDICYTSFQIIEIQKDNIMKHIETEHSADYQRIVLSKGSQKDFESHLYIIQNNDITCKFCNSTFHATNNSYSLTHHLTNTHKITKNKTAKICEKLSNYYYDAFDTNMKRHCTICNETILNKHLHLMSHLSKVHKVDVFLKIRSVKFLTSSQWVWEYYSKIEEQEAKCSVCNQPFFLIKSVSNIISHIKKEHGNICDVLENSKENKNLLYSITEDNKTKCDICDKIYHVSFCATSYMKTHLIEAHNLNKDIARELCNWVLEYFHISKFQTSKCNICENMFQTSNCFDLMIHLKEAHQVRVSPEFIPTRLSSELSSPFNSDRHAQDIVTSSKSQQPTCSFDQSSDCDNFFDQIDESSEIRTTRISISLSNLLNSDDLQDVVTSSKSQPIRSFNPNFDYDYFYDQIDESSEIRTTRLLSSSSRLLNSDNNTEDITASSSY